MSKQKTRRVLTILLAAVFAASVVMELRQWIDYQRTVAAYEEAAELAGIGRMVTAHRPLPASSPPAAETEKPEPDPEPAAPDPDPESEPEEPGEPLPPPPEEARLLAETDLDPLRAVNPDVVGWLSIPDTIISYPLMQGTDNEYYLSHNWKGSADNSGAVFLDHAVSRDFSDFHTIAYAHQLYNGAMFSTLAYYQDPDYWRQHPRVYVILDDGVYQYDIFSVQEAPVRSVVYWLEKERYHMEEDFLRYCLNNSVIQTGVTPDTSQRFLTLSTCTVSGSETTRWVVHGVLAGKFARSIL